MQIRLSGSQDEILSMLTRIRSVFTIDNVSKYRSDTRGSSIVDTGRVYITIADFTSEELHARESLLQDVITDMLNFMKNLEKLSGKPFVEEYEVLRNIYLKSGNMSDLELVSFMSEWKSRLLASKVDMS